MQARQEVGIMEKHFNENGIPRDVTGGILTVLAVLAIGAGMVFILIAFWMLAEVIG